MLMRSQFITQSFSLNAGTFVANMSSVTHRTLIADL
jgi:hypothetical protein